MHSVHTEYVFYGTLILIGVAYFSGHAVYTGLVAKVMELVHVAVNVFVDISLVKTS